MYLISNTLKIIDFDYVASLSQNTKRNKAFLSRCRLIIPKPRFPFSSLKLVLADRAGWGVSSPSPRASIARNAARGDLVLSSCDLTSTCQTWGRIYSSVPLLISASAQRAVTGSVSCVRIILHFVCLQMFTMVFVCDFIELS